MIRDPLGLADALTAALTLSAACASAASIPDNIAAAVGDGTRPDVDKQRDANLRSPRRT